MSNDDLLDRYEAMIDDLTASLEAATKRAEQAEARAAKWKALADTAAPWLHDEAPSIRTAAWLDRYAGLLATEPSPITPEKP